MMAEARKAKAMSEYATNAGTDVIRDEPSANATWNAFEMRGDQRGMRLKSVTSRGVCCMNLL
jgi:hypothetical protein